LPTKTKGHQDTESQYHEIIQRLKSLSNPESVKGMARYGINPATAYGVSVPELRKIAATAKKNHLLAEMLWSSGIHEARILASMVDDPKKVPDDQMEHWARDFNSWDLCDQCCNNLFRKVEHAHNQAIEWSARPEEFVKRAGFVLMACLAVHDKGASDEAFLKFMPIIKRESTDSRNFVKKAVNWALRHIGKRNKSLNKAALATAREINEMDSAAAQWIASDAIRELASANVQKRLA
jgi:3-methyladenine DNA glycosylase AlkD